MSKVFQALLVHVRQKWTVFYLTRSLVLKLVMPAVQQGQLFVYIYIAIKDLSLKLNISISESDLCSGIVL